MKTLNECVNLMREATDAQLEAERAAAQKARQALQQACRTAPDSVSVEAELSSTHLRVRINDWQRCLDRSDEEVRSLLKDVLDDGSGIKIAVEVRRGHSVRLGSPI